MKIRRDVLLNFAMKSTSKIGNIIFGRAFANRRITAGVTFSLPVTGFVATIRASLASIRKEIGKVRLARVGL